MTDADLAAPATAPAVPAATPAATPPADGLNHSARRINAILAALGGRRYLEIGVQRGLTFHSVAAAQKVAVDPNFRFDAADRQADATYHEIASDAYFTEHATGLFDVMFIDGLHTFEQTFRDLCASMRHAHRGTVWIVDDTVPSDIYSARPNQNEAVRARRMAGGRGGAWHGDVYKVVFAVADFFPNLSFATIDTDGNPQTLLWSQPRRAFRPAFNSLERISRLDWFDLQRHMAAMNRVDEATGLGLAIAGARTASADAGAA